MTLSEYNAMQEAKGTPKVWCVDFAGFSGTIPYSSLFETEEEATRYFDSLGNVAYKKIYQTWDIWGWTERHAKERKIKALEEKLTSLKWYSDQEAAPMGDSVHDLQIKAISDALQVAGITWHYTWNDETEKFEAHIDRR